MGHKRTFEHVRPMSALPPKADIETQWPDVCFVPKADILRCGKEPALFDHLVGDGEDAGRPYRMMLGLRML